MGAHRTGHKTAHIVFIILDELNAQIFFDHFIIGDGQMVSPQEVVWPFGPLCPLYGWLWHCAERQYVFSHFSFSQANKSESKSEITLLRSLILCKASNNGSKRRQQTNGFYCDSHCSRCQGEYGRESRERRGQRPGETNISRAEQR